MGSDDFIKLDSPSHSQDQTEGNGCLESQTQETSLSTFNEKVDDVNHAETEDFTDGSNIEVHNVNVEEEGSQNLQNMELEEDDFMPRQNIESQETSLSTFNEKVDDVNHAEAEDFTDGSNIEVHNVNVEEEGSQNLQNMELEEDDFMPKQAILQENVQLFDSLSTLESVDESESKFSTNIISTNSVSNTTMTKQLVDESPVAGFKRARTTCNDQHPSVRVVYNFLTRESKQKLMELMQQWSQWKTNNQSSSNVPGDVTLESGEDVYFAALHVGSERTNAVSFWLDNQGKKENIGDRVKSGGDMVPLYDRGFTFGLTALDGSTKSESGVQALVASRCFNCGSYNHALKECPKPRDNVAISNARKQHGSKRVQNTGSRSQNRYYQKASGKFDDLKAGVLGPETRECLGIGELDPPPWIHRMRQLGYPPGYLGDVEEEQPSGIIIFADEEVNTECEEGELPEKADPTPPKKKMTVEFPGINAPIPENADNWVWATPQSSLNHSSHPKSNRPSESHRASHHDQIEPTDRQDGPPGSSHGFAAFSRPGYSPRYSSQDHSSTPSPHLGRSLSDRSWPSPVLYGSSPIHSPHSPLPYSSHGWQSPQYHPYSNIDHRSYENSHRSNSDARERDQHRNDHHRHHHRR